MLAASCAATAIAAQWLIPLHGLRGAAEAMAVTGIVQLAGSWIILRGIDGRLRANSELETAGASA
jgi:hypothetical protein